MQSNVLLVHNNHYNMLNAEETIFKYKDNAKWLTSPLKNNYIKGKKKVWEHGMWITKTRIKYRKTQKKRPSYKNLKT